jgi:hypothetical protein
MTKEVKLPKWCTPRNIYVMAGIELAAYRPYQGELQLKVGRCNMCGECCTGLDPRTHPFPVIGRRRQCVYLTKEPGNNPMWVCGLGHNRPWGCSTTVASANPGCTEKMEVYEDTVLRL